MSQLAHVDLRRSEYIVWSSSRTVDGIWVMNGRFQRMPEQAGATELGATVEAALAASTQGVPTPPLRDAPSPFQPVLQALGLASYSRYMAGTRSTVVERDGAEVRVVPQRNAGGRGGFVPIPEATVRLDKPDPAVLGAAVLEAITRSS